MSKFKFSNQVLYHGRFRDDGFKTFNGTKNEILEFFIIGNTCHDHLKLLWKNLRWKSKFSWHYNLQGHHIPEEQNTWHSIKPTHNFQYLHRESAHSPPVFRGFVKGEFIRHARNTSDPSIFTKTLNKFKTHFSKRGYSDKETDPIILEICETNRTKYLHKKSTDSKQRQPNVMITKYNPHIKGLKKRILEHWKLLQKHPICKEMFNIEPIIAYSKHKSISELIIHSRLQ